MNDLVRVGDAADDWIKIVSHFARGAGLSVEDVRRILQALRNNDELKFIEGALRQWLVTQAEAAGAPPPAPEPAALPQAPLEVTAQPTEEVVVAHNLFDPHSERIRALRTELLLRRKAGECNVFAVVSAGRGDGRSRLAAELAVACAQLAQPTLLIDADLRHPRQHRLFDARGQAGLAEALDGVAPVLQGVAGLPCLALLTAGAPSLNPLERLSGSGFGELVRGWSRRYQHVVINTPPVGAYTDGLAVAMHCSNVLVVSRGGHTPLRAVREMLRRLATTQVRVLGSVVNYF